MNFALRDACLSFQDAVSEPGVDQDSLYAAMGDLHAKSAWGALAGLSAVARRRFPGFIKGYLLGAAAHRELFEYDVADAILVAASKRYPDSYDVAQTYAGVAAHRRDWPSAAERWDAVRQKFPDKPNGYTKGAKAYFAMDDVFTAYEILQTGSDRFDDPGFELDSMLLKKQSAERREQWNQAVEICMEIRKKFPDNHLGYTGAIAPLLQLSDLTLAEETIKSAQALFPDEPAILLEACRLYLKRGETRSLELTVDELRRTIPHHYETYWFDAEARIARGDLLGARKVYLRCLENTEARWVHAYVLRIDLSLNDFDMALQDAKLAIKDCQHPSFPPGFFHLTVMLLELCVKSSGGKIDDNFLDIIDILLHQQISISFPPSITEMGSNIFLNSFLTPEHYGAIFAKVEEKEQREGITDITTYIRIYYGLIHDEEHGVDLLGHVLTHFPPWHIARLMGQIGTDVSSSFPAFPERDGIFTQWMRNQIRQGDFAGIQPQRGFYLALAAFGINDALGIEFSNAYIESQRGAPLSKPLRDLNKAVERRVVGLAASRRKIPYILFDKGRKLRVAFCVSGQLRQYREAFASWDLLNLRNQGHSVEYFVHTWEDVGNTPSNSRDFISRILGGHMQKVFLTMPSSAAATFSRDYPRMISLFTKSAKVSREELREFYQTDNVVIESEDDPRFTAMTGPKKMYYKIQECIGMLRERRNDFDLVVRLRPELFVTEPWFIDWERLHRDLVAEHAICETTFRKGGLNGSCFLTHNFSIGTFDAMWTFSDIYSRALHNMTVEGHRTGQDFTVKFHDCFAWHSFYSGLAVKDINPRFRFFPYNDSLANEIHRLLLIDIAQRDPLPYDAELVAACEKDMNAKP